MTVTLHQGLTSYDSAAARGQRPVIPRRLRGHNVTDGE